MSGKRAPWKFREHTLNWNISHETVFNKKTFVFSEDATVSVVSFMKKTLRILHNGISSKLRQQTSWTRGKDQWTISQTNLMQHINILRAWPESDWAWQQDWCYSVQRPKIVQPANRRSGPVFFLQAEFPTTFVSWDSLLTKICGLAWHHWYVER